MKARLSLSVPLVVAMLATLGCSSPVVDGTTLTAAPLDGLDARAVAETEGLGTIRAVAETASEMLVAGDQGFALLETSSWTRHADGAARFVAATTAPESVAYARFLGVGAAGELGAIFDDGRTLDLASRYGLEGTKVLGATNLDALGVAFTLADGYAVGREGSVTRVTLPAAREVFSCHASVYVRTTGSLYRLDAAGRPAYVTAFPAELTGAACDERDRLVAMTGTTVWREIGSALAPLIEGRAFANLVRTGTGSAFTSGGSLCLLRDDDLRCEATDRGLTALFPAPGPLPRARTAAGALVAFASRTDDAGTGPDAGDAGDAGGATPSDGGSDAGGSVADGSDTGSGPSADEVAWMTRVKPIAERACFGCHGSVGAASVSLTTYAAWVTNRNAIRQRVVTQQNMPPNGSSLASADRATIAAWLTAN